MLIVPNDPTLLHTLLGTVVIVSHVSMALAKPLTVGLHYF